MPIFVWEGKTRSGAVQKGEMEAANEPVLTAALRKQGIRCSPVSLRHAPSSFIVRAFGGGSTYYAFC